MVCRWIKESFEKYGLSLVRRNGILEKKSKRELELKGKFEDNIKVAIDKFQGVNQAKKLVLVFIKLSLWEPLTLFIK